MKTSLPLNVSLTTLPSRLAYSRPTIESLFAQSLLPDRIFFVLPKTCDREPQGYDIPSWVHEYGPRLQVVRPEHDYGPGSKLLGCVPHLGKEPAVLVLVDDDLSYQPTFLENLYTLQCAELTASFSYYVYSWGALKSIGQGADGFAIYSPLLNGVHRWADNVIKYPPLRVHDDLWISAFLQSKGITVKNVRNLVADAGTAYVKGLGHDINQLRNLQGELAREKVTALGAHYLVAHGYMGRWPQFDHHVRSFVKMLLGRRTATA